MNVVLPELLLVWVATSVQVSAGPSWYSVIGKVPFGKFAVIETVEPIGCVDGLSVSEPVSGPFGVITPGGGVTVVTVSDSLSTAGLPPDDAACTRYVRVGSVVLAVNEYEPSLAVVPDL